MTFRNERKEGFGKGVRRKLIILFEVSKVVKSIGNIECNRTFENQNYKSEGLELLTFFLQYKFCPNFVIFHSQIFGIHQFITYFGEVV